jgi:hypothetical protein
MRKISSAMAALLALGVIPSATADNYVKVDANGYAIGGSIVCDAETCGEGSVYSRLTLGPGERYVLEGLDKSGRGNSKISVGLSAQMPISNEANTTPQTSETTTNVQPLVEPAAIAPTVSETSTITSDTATVSSETRTATSETSTVTMAELDAKIIEIRTLITWLEALLARLGK